MTRTHQEMMKMIKLFGMLLIAIVVTSCNSYNSERKSEISSHDSLAIVDRIEGFYSWYGQVTSKDLSNEYQPNFVSDSEGFATLDMDKYLKNLRTLGFSESLVSSTSESHKRCIENLRSISYDTLINHYNLEEYEKINCDFFNGYIWTKDMEIVDGAELTALQKNDDSTVVAEAKFFIRTGPGDRYYLDHKVVLIDLVQKGHSWLIDDIHINFK